MSFLPGNVWHAFVFSLATLMVDTDRPVGDLARRTVLAETAGDLFAVWKATGRFL
jgi:hypothetical protein